MGGWDSLALDGNSFWSLLDLYTKSSWAGGTNSFLSTVVLLGVYRSLKKKKPKKGGALQLWPAIHLGKGYSELKDMPSPDVQRLFL